MGLDSLYAQIIDVIISDLIPKLSRGYRWIAW